MTFFFAYLWVSEHKFCENCGTLFPGAESEEVWPGMAGMEL